MRCNRCGADLSFKSLPVTLHGNYLYVDCPNCEAMIEINDILYNIIESTLRESIDEKRFNFT